MGQPFFLEMIKDRKVAYITVKNADYIRTLQFGRQLKQYASESIVVSSEKGNPLTRSLDIRKKIRDIDLNYYDVVIAGFLPQLIWKDVIKGLRVSGSDRTVLIADMFLSLYDTVVLDRKLFSRSGLIAGLCKKLDKLVVNDASLIITDTKADAEYFINEFGEGKAVFETLYLEADPEFVNMDGGIEEHACEYSDIEACGLKNSDIEGDSSEGSFISDVTHANKILYFGTGLPLQGTGYVVDAMKILSEECGCECVYIGGDRYLTSKQKKALRSANITYYKYLPQADLYKKIASADMCLAGHFAPDIDKSDRTIPGKAFIYELYGKKMILGDTRANHEIFSPDERHIFVKRGSAKAIVEAVRSVYGAVMKEADNKLCVSMILPIYNAKRCLSRCLESILSQTMPLDKFEVILVDDGSTDGSDSICDEYSNAYENINVIHKKNGGAASARNAGLLEATGEYIAFVDPDDYLDADYLKIPYEEAYKTEADIVIFDAIKEYPKDKGAGDRNKNKVVAKNNTRRLLRHSEKVFVTSDPQDIMSMRCQILYPYMNAHACGEDFFRNIPLAAPWDKLYRKSFLDENDLRFSEELKVLDDMCFNFVAF